MSAWTIFVVTLWDVFGLIGLAAVLLVGLVLLIYGKAKHHA